MQLDSSVVLMHENRDRRNGEQSWNTWRSGKGDRCWVEGVGGVITRIEEFIYCRKRALRSMEPESMRSEKQVDQAVKRAPLFCWMIWRCTASLCCLLGFHFMRFRWIPGSRVCKWNHSCFDSSQLIKTRGERINITVNKTGGLAWQQKSYWHKSQRAERKECQTSEIQRAAMTREFKIKSSDEDGSCFQVHLVVNSSPWTQAS